MEALNPYVDLVPLDQFLENLYLLLKPTEVEVVELREKGYSLSLSIKDKFRILLQILAGNISQSSFEINDLFKIINSWEELTRLIESSVDLSSLNQNEKLIYLAASESYWEVYLQIEQDIITQLKESKLYDFNEIINGKNINDLETLNQLKTFVEEHDFKQRIFEYDFEQNKHKMMIESALRCFIAKNSEREYVELLNLLKLWELKYHNAIDLLKDVRLPDGILEFLEIEIMRYSEVNIEIGDLFIEFSPPIYKHQKDIMLRIYEYTVLGWQSRVFSLPYNEQALASDLQTLKSLSIATPSLQNFKHERNNILSETILVQGIQQNEILRNLELINSTGSLPMLELNDLLIKPKINAITAKIHPFIKTLMLNLVQTVQNPALLNFYAKQYQQVLDAAWLTYMPKLDEISAEDQDKLNEDLLEVVSNGGSISEYISENTDIAKSSEDGKLNFSASSECGEVNIQLERTGKDSKQNDLKSEGKNLSQEQSSELNKFGFNIQKTGKVAENFDPTKLTKILGFKAENIEIVNGKSGIPLIFFDKNNQGKIERHLLCPVCQKASIDVCDLKNRCINCNTLGKLMKDAEDKELLKELREKYEAQQNQKNIEQSNSNLRLNNKKRPSAIDTFIENIVGFKWIF